VDHVAKGDRVLAMLPWGAYATQAVARSQQVIKIPDVMPFEHAAAFTIVYQTSYFALVFRAPLIAGQTLLVHGAAGGVGLSALQIGRTLGARVLATAGSEEKRAFVKAQGADVVFDSRDPSWVEGVMEATQGKGADHIYDPVGGEVFDLSLKCIAFGGNLHVIGFASGTIPSCAMNRVLLKNISLVGLHWGAYQQKDPEKVPQAMRALFTMYEAGKLPVQIGGRYPLERAADALAEIASRRAQGKVVLTIS
jgi:NADPH2:quinone reductase